MTRKIVELRPHKPSPDVAETDLDILQALIIEQGAEIERLRKALLQIKGHIGWRGDRNLIVVAMRAAAANALNGTSDRKQADITTAEKSGKKS